MVLKAFSIRSLKDIGYSTSFIEDEDISNTKIPAKSKSASGGSRHESGAGKLSHLWLNQCLRTHSQCRRGLSLDKRLPARVLEVGLQDEPQIRLRITQADTPYEHYATLSHRWGSADHTKLTTGTINDWLNGIPISTLPKTYRHAIFVVRFPVYGGAEEPRLYKAFVQNFWIQSVLDQTLNTRGWVLQERLLSPRILHFTKQQLFWECRETNACESFPEGLNPSVNMRFSGRLDSLLERLEQERAKNSSGKPASRQNYVEWLNTVQGQTSVDLTQDDTVSSETSSRAEARAFLQTLSQESQVLEDSAYRLWLEIVQEYSGCHLTIESDILIAIWGISEHFQRSLGDICYSGIMSKQWVTGLLWETARPSMRHKSHQEPVRRNPPQAPTWSWASIRGEVRWAFDLLPPLPSTNNLAYKQPYAGILGVRYSPKAANQIHQVDGLHIRGIKSVALIGNMINNRLPLGNEEASGRNADQTFLRIYDPRARRIKMLSMEKLYDGIVLFDDDVSLNSLAREDGDHVVPCIPLVGIRYYDGTPAKFQLAKTFTIYGLLLRMNSRCEFERMGLLIVESKDQSLLKSLDNEVQHQSCALMLV